ncbi:hypothetical protein H6P81_006393 [Aristolochia fimbriata]|uniref:Uncharacterized protein n=1 Tax=Aristolochia fimbriata TaxID=158543 RepID=A0AAV7EYJ9_ARIFI|nr:hypothetical protein H6P81_006393 [Aristolochia fimbriata]
MGKLCRSLKFIVTAHRRVRPALSASSARSRTQSAEIAESSTLWLQGYINSKCVTDIACITCSSCDIASRFKRFHVGMRLGEEFSVPYDKSKSHKAALVFCKHVVPTMVLLRATFAKEWLIKRNLFVYFLYFVYF